MKPLRNALKQMNHGGDGAGRRLALTAAVGLVFAMLALALEYRLSEERPSRAAEPMAPVRISEAMSQNRTALEDDLGARPDWIEIVNRGDEPVNLAGWRLLTADKPLSAFVFPDYTLEAGEYALVYAGGVDRAMAMQAPFRLSASGEEIILLDKNGARADSVSLPALKADESYALDEAGLWQITLQASPGAANREENSLQRATAEDAICLSEIIPSNVSLLPGGEDLIEIVNASANPVSLAGYMLSDNPTQADKYTLGDVVLAPGECHLIRADGVEVSFRLSAAGEALFLTNPSGRLVGQAVWENMGSDRSLSWVDGEWTDEYPPTPGLPNSWESVAQMDARARENNPTGVVISEVMASSAESYDWVELYNQGGERVTLTGMGLSDDPARPRKWQFPEKMSLGPGEYVVIQLSGRDTIDRAKRVHASFRLSATGGETITLSLADGQIVDRMPLPRMYGDVSLGRVQGANGLYYFTQATPGAANGATACVGRADKPVFSVSGGLYSPGDSVTLDVSAPGGATVRYTLDGSEPTEASPVWSGPMTITQSTVVRATAWRENMIPSYVETASYLFIQPHTVPVVSVVSDPRGLFSDETGIMAKGPHVVDSDPYTGANFWEEWERAAHVEIFTPDGETIVDQGCGLSLHGANSRKRPQKALQLTARMSYDEDNRFRARLFSDRDYEAYQSFVLRSGGQDDEMTRIRDTIVDQLAADTEVFYQESELCVAYINGEYWGQYDLREKINRFSIAQFEGWDGGERISIVKNANLVLRGSDRTYAELMEWIAERDQATDEDIAYVEKWVDLDNYLDYVCVMVYSGNQDIGMRRYKNDDADGKWRWVVFDMDYAFYNDTDSMRRWMDPAGAGAHNAADNRLFVYVMKNEGVKDRFLTRFFQLVTGPWSAENMVAAIQRQHDEMLPEMERHYQRWTNSSLDRWEKYIAAMLEFAATRQEKIIEYTRQHFGLTDEQMKRYSGGAIHESPAGE